MKQEYFVVNGTKYYTGAVFLVNHMGKQTEASFVHYDIQQQKYVYKINECIWHVDDKNFWRMFISITDKVDNKTHAPEVKKRKDSEIDGLFIGWIWYIFLMLVSVIFKQVLLLWLIISVVFFVWRAKKIKEEGTYIEW